MRSTQLFINYFLSCLLPFSSFLFLFLPSFFQEALSESLFPSEIFIFVFRMKSFLTFFWKFLSEADCRKLFKQNFKSNLNFNCFLYTGHVSSWNSNLRAIFFMFFCFINDVVEVLLTPMPLAYNATRIMMRILYNALILVFRDCFRKWSQEPTIYQVNQPHVRGR